jgi:3-hydroxymyristoyl/3-hydroxydecanoyl-(acyl carrier protein) dehydratase
MNDDRWWQEFDSGKVLDKTSIDATLPHRGDMSFLNRVSLLEDDSVIGEVLLDDTAFWAPGHFPVPEVNDGAFKIGPIFPGVLMIESAAQLGIVFWRNRLGMKETSTRTMLFKQIEKASFNKEARPGDRLLIRGTLDKASLRLMRCRFQGIVFKADNEEPFPCFECQIAGLSV